jgi:hypothetical protein
MAEHTMMNNSKCFLQLKVTLLVKVTLLIALFFTGLSLPAQSGRYKIEQHFVQQLVWVGDEYTLKYEVVVELDEGAGYRVFMREFTELPKIQISLLPGNYRYRVIPFDYLEQPGEASDWIILNVRPAPIVPVEVQANEDDSYVLTPYEDAQLVPGVNEIVIKNPNELESNEGIITVEKQEPPGPEKRVDIFLNAAWAPLIPLYGGIQEIFGREFYFTGAALRFGLVFTKPKLINPGLELSTSWYALSKAQGNDEIELQTGVISVNFIIQKWLPNRKIAFSLRAGGGLAFQLGDLMSEQNLYIMDRLLPQINLDPSFLWLILKQFYVEAGASYTLFMNKSNPSSCLRPSIGIGWQF